MENQVDEIKTIFKHVSQETFVKYFYVFEKNKNFSSNIEILDSFKTNEEQWTKKSCATRASKGKSIFKKNLQIVALKYITENSNENKITTETLLNAKEILNRKMTPVNHF